MNETYSSYLQSAAWEEIRTKRLALAGFKCEACGCTTRLQVHHLTYERIFRENMDDLMALCDLHHKAAEEMIQKRVIPRTGCVEFIASETLRYIAPRADFRKKHPRPIRQMPPRFVRAKKKRRYDVNAIPVQYRGVTKDSRPATIQALLLADPAFMKIIHLPQKKYRKACRALFGKSPMRGKIISNAQVVYRTHPTGFPSTNPQ